MGEHLSKCFHPQCKEIKEVVLIYGFSKNLELEDRASFICNADIPGLGYKNS